MAIAPLQLPGPLIVPKLDFSSLDKIGDAYVQNQKEKQFAAALAGINQQLVEDAMARGVPIAPTAASTVAPTGPAATPTAAARSATPKYERTSYTSPSALSREAAAVNNGTWKPVDDGSLALAQSVINSGPPPPGGATMGGQPGATAEEIIPGAGQPVPPGGPGRVAQPGQLPLGLRNNNPAYVPDDGVAKVLPGYKGAEGGYATFETPDHGVNATDALLISYGRRGIKTGAELAQQLPGMGMDANKAEAYARFISPNYDPNAPIDLSDPAQRKQIVGKMGVFANDMHGGMGMAAPAAQLSPAQMAEARAGMSAGMAKRVQALAEVGTPAAQQLAIAITQKYIGKQEPIKLGEGEVLVDPNTGQVIGRAPEKAYSVRPGGALVRGGQVQYEAPKQLTPVVTGTDVLGHPSRGTFNPATGEYRDVQGRPIGQGGAAPGQAGGELHGEEFLKTQDPGIRDDIKAMAQGRLPSAGFGSQKNLLPLVAQYDPNFDATQYPTMLATRKNYTSGKQFQEIQAINTVAGHLGNLMRSADDLNNTRFPWWNTIANTALQATGDPRVDKFNTDKQAVTNELSKAYRGGHITEGDVREWQSNISAAKSPAQLKAVIGEFNDLLMSKRQALEDGYRSSMGTAPLPKEFTAESASARKAFDAVEAWSHGVKEGSAPEQPAAGSPAAGQPQEGERRQFKQGWGVFHNGQWVPVPTGPRA